MNQEKTHRLGSLIIFLEKHYTLICFCIIALSLFNIFYKIDSLNFNFDEARHGVNAYEMLKNNDFIVHTYNYSIDYWNLKPPLIFWTIIMGYRIFGFNPIGLRVFSCLSGLLTIIIVGLFVKQKYGRLPSLLSMIILATNMQFMFFHCVRGGEADAFYVLCFTIFMLSMICIEKNSRYIYLLALSASMAFMLKSWHVFAMGAIFIVYMLISNKYKIINFQKMAFSLFDIPLTNL